jgi:hypothetical protein
MPLQQVFAPLWGPLARKRLRPRDDDTLHSFYGRLRAKHRDHQGQTVAKVFRDSTETSRHKSNDKIQAAMDLIYTVSICGLGVAGPWARFG